MVQASTKWYLLAGGLVIVLSVALTIRVSAVALSEIDRAVLRGVARLRVDPLTSVARQVDRLSSVWTVRVLAWPAIAVLIVYRRFRYLALYLGLILAGTLCAVAGAQAVGRMRPTEGTMLTGWVGYSYPSRPVVALGLVMVGVAYTLVPSGRWRRRVEVPLVGVLLLFGLCRIYLGVDHPTDVLAALAIGWAIPVVAFRLIIPEDAFPVSYRPGRRAHLDVTGRRGEAIVQALDHQLGLRVVGIEPFGLGGSAGSTPLRLTVERPDGSEIQLFAKLYALSHLRADRWYKLARTVLYGRLEDEKPFSTVRRLAEYEDHLLRLLRDAGLPTPTPFGFAEITPEREYVIVMSFFEHAREIGPGTVDRPVIDDALAIVRRLWDAGIAHRDIKPSNLLIRDEQVLLIDVAFATVRPTPWRQAVDLANMMLTLALWSTPELVYERALAQFSADDVAEAFAASRSITIPSQLRALIRSDGRDLPAAFCALAPPREPIRIQVWSLRRAAATAGAVLLVASGVGLAFGYARVSGLA